MFQLLIQLNCNIDKESSGKGDSEEDGENCNNRAATCSRHWGTYLYMLFIPPTWRIEKMLYHFKKVFTWWEDLPLSSLVLNKHDIAVVLFSLSHLRSSWQILANQLFKHLSKFSKYILLFISLCQEWRPVTYVICQGCEGCPWQKQDTLP